MTRLSTRGLTRTLGVQQQLVPGRRTVTGTCALVAHLIGLQAQDNLPPYLSLAARTADFDPHDVSDLLVRRALVCVPLAARHCRQWMSSNGASGCTLFVDGLLAGRWSHDGSRFDLEVFRPLTRSERRGLEAGQERVAGLLARLTQRATRLAITRSGFRVRFVRE